MVVRTLLGHEAGELGHLHLMRELFQEGSEEDLALAGLKPVHQAWDGPLHVVLGPMDQLLVDEVIVGESRLGMVDVHFGRAAANPLLASISLPGMEGHVNKVVILLTRQEGQLVLLQVREVLPSLCRCAGSKPLVVLASPPSATVVSLFPGFVLGHREEGDHFITSADLNDWCHELAQKAFTLQEVRKPVLYEVDDEALDVGSVEVLVRHNHQGAVPQAACILVLLGCIEGHDLHQSLNLLVIHHLLLRQFPDVP
mmetsp:Transcript_62103/g.145738  ORF Transcript_62103/g.145738 Transcript_62103/m.145738 type:complete len:255 (-) Transcript_62103:340-1104(-)